MMLHEWVGCPLQIWCEAEGAAVQPVVGKAASRIEATAASDDRIDENPVDEKKAWDCSREASGTASSNVLELLAKQSKNWIF